MKHNNNLHIRCNSLSIEGNLNLIVCTLISYYTYYIAIAWSFINTQSADFYNNKTISDAVYTSVSRSLRTFI